MSNQTRKNKAERESLLDFLLGPEPDEGVVAGRDTENEDLFSGAGTD